MAGSDLDIDSVVNALLKEYGYGEPEPRENTTPGAGRSAVGKKEPADPGVLSRIAEKMATADKRKEVYCEVCGLVKVKSGSSGVPVCERCYKRMSVLREGRKEAVEFYSDPRNTQRSSRRVKKYIQDAIDAARSRDLELRTGDIPTRPAPKAEENPPAAPAAVRISAPAPAPAPAPARAEDPAAMPAPASAPVKEPAPVPAPVKESSPVPAAAPAAAKEPAPAPAPRAGRLSAAELLEQIDGGSGEAAPSAGGRPVPAEDNPLVAELTAQLMKSGKTAADPAKPPAEKPVRRKKHQAERTAPRGEKPPVEPALNRPVSAPAPAAAPAAEPEEALPSLEEILAQVREEMPEAPAPAPAEKRPASPAPAASAGMNRHPAAPAPSSASRAERPAAPRLERHGEETRPSRMAHAMAESGAVRLDYPSLEEMLTPIGDIPPETAAERAAEAGRPRRKKQSASAGNETASAAQGGVAAPETAADMGRPRRKKPPAPIAEEAPARPERPEKIKSRSPRKAEEPAAEPAAPSPRPENPPARPAPEAPAPRAGRRTAKTEPPIPAEKPEAPEPPPEPEKPREEPSIEEILSRTEEVLPTLDEEDDMPPAEDGPLSRAEAAAHTRTERHLARSAAPRIDERAARKASRPAFALNRPCEACGADEWVGIDGAYSYIELCNNCEKRKVEFNKQEYVDNFECPNCGGLTGTREENKRKFGVRCSNCGELTICFRKVDELLMDEKLTAALTDYAKALVSDQNGPVTCPQCGSDSITSSGAGLFGSRTVNRCARCGCTWKPRWQGR